ncbi:MAG: hypothetical protein COV73_05960 [Candidatus Omnitrophica bacterium CG11_big_fil_rev_8_21_14_0_20_43_6]|nr:MAG: hypothetical protein COV73_05960 [Candidatus Omnitrophica bacterium CG11_big_fil_rev_8_21_14_0_20_43_6]
MIFNIRVSPRASRNRVEQTQDTLKVYLTKPAADGLANAQLIDLLSAHFKIKKYQIRIKSGVKSRNKLVEIDAAI